MQKCNNSLDSTTNIMNNYFVNKIDSDAIMSVECGHSRRVQRRVKIQKWNWHFIHIVEPNLIIEFKKSRSVLCPHAPNLHCGIWSNMSNHSNYKTNKSNKSSTTANTLNTGRRALLWTTLLQNHNIIIQGQETYETTIIIIIIILNKNFLLSHYTWRCTVT